MLGRIRNCFLLLTMIAALGALCAVTLPFDLGRGQLIFLYVGALGVLYLAFWMTRVYREEPTGLAGLLMLGTFLLAILLWGLGKLAEAFGHSWDSLAVHTSALWWVFGIAFILCVVWVMVEAEHYQVYVRERLERDLGFRYGKVGEQITLCRIQPGGLLDQAGFREMDVIADVSITGFFRLLELARGGDPVTLTVIPWSATEWMSRRPRRRLTVRVPAKDFDIEL
jgi:hypothetical protein